ncbi:MAG TPA: glycoside hydrolase family 3 N-terminal domain-containing protein [Ktedonobacteraceae bacterium]|nr:glycoside hydrolase family 3 N-terminal domain-containing protein [Ktedonobacteraceae bacterium]
MDLIESTLSDMSDQAKKAEEAQERATAESLSTMEDQNEAEQQSGDGEGTGEKSALKAGDQAMSVYQPESEKPGAGARMGAVKSANEDEDTPHRLPAARADKIPETPFRPPMTPRKNVIPSRRAMSPGFAPASSADKRGAGIAENAAEKKVSQPLAAPVQPAEKPAGEFRQAPTNAEQPDTSEMPTRTDLPATSVSGQSHPAISAQEPESSDESEFASLASPPASYHDTSAAEAAWRENDVEDEFSRQETHILAATTAGQMADDQHVDRQPTAELDHREAVASMATRSMALVAPPITPPVTPPVAPPITPQPVNASSLSDVPTTPMPSLAPVKPPETQRRPMTRKRALLMAALLAILLVNAIAASFDQSFGANGWATVWDNQGGSNQNLLTQIAQQLQHSPTAGSSATAAPTATPSPTQIVNLLLSQMTLDEKLGQMMMVQFTGPDYSPQLDAMISHYKVGSVLVFAANGNIVSKSQLKNLISQMQKNAFLPLAISIDQEGGTVDRLIDLDGPQPAAATIGATGDTNKAYQQGLKDAEDLTSYGINLNLAPVVDVTNVYNPQLYNRTYGKNAAIVTSMAGAYLQGLQKSGKVLGTLKHFPGLGDVSVDPHDRPPDLTRSLSSLNSIDWAPYTNLINQGNVYAVMVTHEYVKALDSSVPSSLSPRVIGILRNQMHFQGVIMTDSLTMDSISNYYSYGQAAAMAVEAGDDMLMGASSPNDLAAMVKGIKQALTAGKISQQQIDDSVRRILLLKYAMGLIHI